MSSPRGGGEKHAKTANGGLVVEYRDRAQGRTVELFTQNLHATHSNLAKSSGGPDVAAELRGDGPLLRSTLRRAPRP
eukprot:1242532-Prymnesium_polylepis.2